MAELMQGWCPSNTTPQSIQKPLINHPNYLFCGGLDYFAWSALVEWDNDCFKNLFDQLKSFKEYCQEFSKPSERVYLAGSIPAFVHRTGANRGGERGVHFPYCITHAGLRIALGDWQPTQRTQDNLFIEMKGKDCLNHGAWETHQHITEIVNKLGGKILDEKLSRADFCLDIANLPVSELQELIQARNFITKFKVVSPYENLVNELLTGFSAGNSPKRLIAYDKLEQTKNKCDQEYVQALIQRRYGGIVPEHATRIEIQLGRESLIKSGISRPRDVLVHGPFALRQLMTETFRLTDIPIPVGTKNHSRAEIHPLWESIINGFETVFGSPGEKPVPIDRSKLIQNNSLSNPWVACEMHFYRKVNLYFHSKSFFFWSSMK
ncbi:hypothetical protein [uncultured Rubinisphaera sp.]|uniref:hypothetical protein n=1 Tax=uncultured Rubinisphaera sp. TaxID=1678686 RepID=UPI0030DB77A4